MNHRFIMACLAFWLQTSHAWIIQSSETCSGHGFIQPDTGTCTCNDCYTGDSCQTYNNKCIIDATVADGYMFQEWFLNNPNASKWQVTLPSWFRMQYQDPFVYPTFDNELNRQVHQTLERLHESVNNVNITDRHLVLGFGSTQVIRAIMWSISKKEKRPMYMYARPPFYPTFRSWADKNPAVSHGLTNRTDLDPADVIELVTWPNNPDGSYSEPVYSNAAYHIYDCVYNWPGTSGLGYSENMEKFSSSSPSSSSASSPSSSSSQTRFVDKDIVVFSASKLTGHASSRVGWGWLKDPMLAYGLIGFLFTETYGLSVDSLYRVRDILDRLPSSEFFHATRATFQHRWEQILKLFPKENIASDINHPNLNLRNNVDDKFTLETAPYTWFAWIKCNQIPSSSSSSSSSSSTGGKETCTSIFKNVGIQGSYGDDASTGVEGRIRLNLNLEEEAFNTLLKRLTSLVNPTN